MFNFSSYSIKKRCVVITNRGLIDVLGPPSEVSPWYYFKKELILRHKATCPKCNFPLEIFEFEQYRSAYWEINCGKDIYVEKYESRKGLHIFCVKDKHKGYKDKHKGFEEYLFPNYLGYTVEYTQISSCGGVSLCLPFESQSHGYDLEVSLFESPNLFSKKLLEL